MKKFIRHICAFSCILVLLSVLGYMLFSSLHTFTPSVMYYYDEFNKAFTERNADLVAIGNSKLLSSLDKDVLQKELQLTPSILGYSSANIAISRLTLESYLDKCRVVPKVVLLEVSWFTFNENRTSFHSISGGLLLEDYKLFSTMFRYDSHMYHNLSRTLNKQILGFFTHFANDSYECTFEERSPQVKGYSFDIADFEKVFPTHKAGINPLFLEDFYYIVDLCRKKNIQLILYTAPEDKEYTLLQEDRAEVKKIFTDLAKSEANSMFLDYTFGGDLYNEKFELWLRDSHHINEKDLFTHVLAQDITMRMRNNVPNE